MDGLASSAESFEMDDYMDRLRFMEQEYEIIKSDPLLEDVDFSDLEKTYELLDTKLNESPMAPQNAKDLLNMVAAVSFTEETTTVISYESNWSRGRLAENDDDEHGDDTKLASIVSALYYRTFKHFGCLVFGWLYS